MASTEITFSQVQQNFLSNYGSTGDIDYALRRCKIELNHLLTWCQESPQFDIEYRKIKRFYLAAMRDNCHMMSLQQIHNALVEGCIKETTTQQTTRMDQSGELVYFETKMKVVERPIPFAYLQFMLQENSMMQAVQQAANEGLLTTTQYKQLMSLTDEISTKAQKIALGENKADTLTENKAIALIKQAVLGCLPE